MHARLSLGRPLQALCRRSTRRVSLWKAVLAGQRLSSASIAMHVCARAHVYVLVCVQCVCEGGLGVGHSDALPLVQAGKTLGGLLDRERTCFDDDLALYGRTWHDYKHVCLTSMVVHLCTCAAGRP